jgi:hypothetical protein
MDLGYCGRALSNTGRHSFNRPGSDIADREDAGAARLQRQLRRLAGYNEAFIIQSDATIEPLGVRIGADEKEHMLRIDLPAISGIVMSGRRDGEPPVFVR